MLSAATGPRNLPTGKRSLHTCWLWSSCDKQWVRERYPDLAAEFVPAFSQSFSRSLQQSIIAAVDHCKVAQGVGWLNKQDVRNRIEELGIIPSIRVSTTEDALF